MTSSDLNIIKRTTTTTTTSLLDVSVPIGYTRYGEASDFAQEVALEVNPCPNVATGEDEAGSWEAPQADLEGVVLPPFQKSHVSAFCCEERLRPAHVQQSYVGHCLRAYNNFTINYKLNISVSN